MTQPSSPDRTAWMTGRFGLMNHWLFPGVLPEREPSARTLDEAVDRFDVDRLVEDVCQCGADWLIFTLGQNTGFYASPNPVIERLAGTGHCSQRDLAYEIAARLHQAGKRFIAYLPCEVAANTSMHPGFAWRAAPDTDQAEFQRRYTQAVSAWAERFGDLLDGWWFDGCYTWPVFHSRYMDWPLWLDAARAGNPNAAVTFNDGSFCIGNLTPVHPAHDYLSGETEMLIDGWVRLGRDADAHTHLPAGRFVAGTTCQWHSLLPIDCFWMHGSPPPAFLPDQPFHYTVPDGYGPMEPPVYSDAELGRFLHTCLDAGGAVTFNVGIYQEGHLGRDTVEQLRRIK